MDVKEIKNFSNEDFTCTWDNVPYTVRAGQSMHLEGWKADHIAKHLVDREMNKLGIPTNQPDKRQELIDLCFPPSTEEVAPQEVIDKNIKKTKKIAKKEEEKTEDEPEF